MIKGRLKSQINRYFEILLMVLFVGYYACSTLFVHSHYYHNQLITHSHPYQKGADGQPLHQHDATEFETISVLNNITFVAPVLAAAAVFTIHVFKRRIKQTVEAITLTIFHHSLRAPPVLG